MTSPTDTGCPIPDTRYPIPDEDEDEHEHE
jgi:hypothetical protein